MHHQKPKKGKLVFFLFLLIEEVVFADPAIHPNKFF